MIKLVIIAIVMFLVLEIIVSYGSKTHHSMEDIIKEGWSAHKVEIVARI